MGYKWITVTGDSGKTSFKVSQGSNKIYVYNGSGNSIGETRTMEDAISLIKATYGKKVWNIDIGDDTTSCFSGTTPVLTPSGWRPISILGPGDLILALNLSSFTLQVETVKKRQDHFVAQIWEVYMADNPTPISTTSRHPFLTNQGWVPACQLKPNQSLVGVGSHSKIYRTVKSALKTERFEQVHNLVTTGPHNFVVDGLIVHNFVFAKNIRTFLNQVFIDPGWRVAIPKQLQGSLNSYIAYSQR